MLVKDDWLQQKAGFGEMIGRFYLPCSDRTCLLVLVKDDWLQQKAGFGEMIGRLYLLLVVTEPVGLC